MKKIKIYIVCHQDGGLQAFNNKAEAEKACEDVIASYQGKFITVPFDFPEYESF